MLSMHLYVDKSTEVKGFISESSGGNKRLYPKKINLKDLSSNFPEKIINLIEKNKFNHSK